MNRRHGDPNAPPALRIRSATRLAPRPKPVLPPIHDIQHILTDVPSTPPEHQLHRPGGTTFLTPEEAAAVDDSLGPVVEALGGRSRLAHTLEAAPPDLEAVLATLADPTYDHLPLRDVCRLAGVTILDLFAAYRNAALARAHLLAYHEIAERLVAVVKDVMMRAAPYPIPCAACGGVGDHATGAAPRPKICRTCRGKGQVLQLPSLAHQKLALELGHLLSRTPLLVQQQQTIVAQPSASLVDLQQAVAAALRTRAPLAPVVDVTPTPVSSETAPVAPPE